MSVALTPSDFTLTATETRTGSKVHIAKFLAIWKRKEVYRARAKLQGTGVFLAEHLDREQQELFFKCRTLCKENKLYRAWSFDLDIFVKKSAEASPIKINKDDDLTQFLLSDTASTGGSTGGDSTPPLSRSSSDFQGFNNSEINTTEEAIQQRKRKLIEELQAQIDDLRAAGPSQDKH